jgi:hypothetical protein
MNDTCKTVKVVAPESPDGFIVINESDFDAERHELIDEGGSDASKPMTVAQIKAALAEKGVEIPDGVTLKADLQALLDAQG